MGAVAPTPVGDLDGRGARAGRHHRTRGPRRRGHAIPQRRVRVELPIPPRLARETVLVEHADDGHHGEPAVRQLGVQLPRSALAFGHGAAAVRYAQNACILKISWFSSGIVFQQRRLQNATEAKPLEHARSWHLGKRRQSVRNLLELQTLGRRQVSWELDVLWHNVAQACDHTDAAVLDLGYAAALEGLRVPVLAETRRIPEPNGRLHSELALESPDRYDGWPGG